MTLGTKKYQINMYITWNLFAADLFGSAKSLLAPTIYISFVRQPNENYYYKHYEKHCNLDAEVSQLGSCGLDGGMIWED